MAVGTPIFFSSPEAWGSWLDTHGADEDEVAVGFWKRASGQATLTWDEAVDEALCRGWIDGIRRSIDGDRYQIRFTPRRARSNWSAKNVRRVAELQAAGRMQPAGLLVFEARVGDSEGYSLRARTNTELPPEYQRQLAANTAAFAFFEAQPAGYRKNAVHWVTEAKREETQLRRLRTLIEDSSNGLRIKLLRR